MTSLLNGFTICRSYQPSLNLTRAWEGRYHENGLGHRIQNERGRVAHSTPSNPLGPGQKKIRPEKLRDGLPMTQMQGTASKTHPPGGP